MKLIYATRNYDVITDEELLEECRENMRVNHYSAKEINNVMIGSDRFYQFVYDYYEDWIDCEKANLNVLLDENIIAIASVGLWNGRVRGYKELSNKLSDIFSCFLSCEESMFYAEKGNVSGKGIHHDGSNCITYRKWREKASYEMREKTLDAIRGQSNKAESLIKRYTQSIYPDVAKVYGW